MKFKLTKHNNVGNKYFFSGTLHQFERYDHVTEDGKLVHHYNEENYQVFQPDEFKIVYDSAQELERMTKK